MFIPQKSSKTEKKEIYTSDEEEKEEVKVEEKKVDCIISFYLMINIINQGIV